MRTPKKDASRPPADVTSDVNWHAADIDCGRHRLRPTSTAADMTSTAADIDVYLSTLSLTKDPATRNDFVNDIVISLRVAGP